MPSHLRPVLVLAVLLLTSAACDEKLTTLAGPTPNLEPTFASIQREVFETTDSAGRTSCVTCHRTTNLFISGGMNLTHDLAYDQLVGVASRTKPGATRVIPGDPDHSYIIRKVEGASGIEGRRMPNDGPPYLTNGQILILRRWIAIGAPRN